MRGGSLTAKRGKGGGSGLVAWPVFKTATETPSAAPVGSIPTRSRHWSLAISLTLFLGGAAAAQPPDSVVARALPPPVAPLPTPIDSSPLRAPVKPIKAFFMSLAVPGWGQARLDRKLTGALFITVEGLSVGMTMKTIRELKYLSRVEADTGRISSKRRQRQDWLVLLGFNHLFAGLEAFVATELHQFPADVRFRALPGGRFGAVGSIPFRIR